MTDPETTQNFLDRIGGVNRRRFLLGLGGGAAALTLAACGSSDSDGASSDGDTNSKGSASTTTTADDETTTTEGKDAGGADDGAIAKKAAGLEVLAVGTYQAALDAATAGKLGDVPPAVGEFVKTAMANHQEHLDAWNKVITEAGGDEVTEPDADLKPTVDDAFAKVADVVGAAKLALMLEEVAADTYLAVLPLLGSKDAIKLAGSIQVVDRQHQSILLYALGEYPVPLVFQSTDKSAA